MTHVSVLHLFLLGAFRIERGAQTIHLPTRKVESLLAYLALYPEAHTREKLAALFWGDSPDAGARASLRVALNNLRKRLDEEIVLMLAFAGPGSYSLDQALGIVLPEPPYAGRWPHPGRSGRVRRVAEQGGETCANQASHTTYGSQQLMGRAFSVPLESNPDE